MENRVAILASKIKVKLKENKTVYFWANLLRYWRRKDFRELVSGYGGADVVLVQHLGNLYPEKLVYYIHVEEAGFFSALSGVLMHLLYAERFHLIPVIHWGGEKLCPYKEDYPVNGTSNVFEYYYQPVSEIAYTDINNCHNVVFSYSRQRLAILDGKYFHEQYRDQLLLVSKLGSLYKKYCRLNLAAQTYIESNVKKTLAGKRTLGIHVRGTDFKKAFNNHPVYIDAKDFVVSAKKLLKKHGYEQIFLATDSLQALKLFRKEFGDKLVFYDDVLRSDGDAGVHCLENDRKNHHYLLGLEVLRDAYTLAACNSLLAGMSNVSLAAQYIKIADGSEHEEAVILDHGINHNKRNTNKCLELKVDNHKKGACLSVRAECQGRHGGVLGCRRKERQVRKGAVP